MVRCCQIEIWVRQCPVHVYTIVWRAYITLFMASSYYVYVLLFRARSASALTKRKKKDKPSTADILLVGCTRWRALCEKSTFILNWPARLTLASSTSLQILPTNLLVFFFTAAAELFYIFCLRICAPSLLPPRLLRLHTPLALHELMILNCLYMCIHPAACH